MTHVFKMTSLPPGSIPLPLSPSKTSGRSLSNSHSVITFLNTHPTSLPSLFLSLCPSPSPRRTILHRSASLSSLSSSPSSSSSSSSDGPKIGPTLISPVGRFAGPARECAWTPFSEDDGPKGFETPLTPTPQKKCYVANIWTTKVILFSSF